jgi:hypothetical protein
VVVSWANARFFKPRLNRERRGGTRFFESRLNGSHVCWDARFFKPRVNERSDEREARVDQGVQERRGEEFVPGGAELGIIPGGVLLGLKEGGQTQYDEGGFDQQIPESIHNTRLSGRRCGPILPLGCGVILTQALLSLRANRGVFYRQQGTGVK